MTKPRIRMTILEATLTVTTLVASVALIVLILQCARVSLSAEKTLHTYEAVLKIVAKYLGENGGRWPKSWDDLVRVRHDGFVGLRWPEDVAQVKERVRIDFGVTTEEVVLKGAENFTAVEQIGPSYGSFPWFTAEFLENARRSIDRAAGPTVRKGDVPEWAKEIERAQQKR